MGRDQFSNSGERSQFGEALRVDVEQAPEIIEVQELKDTLTNIRMFHTSHYDAMRQFISLDEDVVAADSSLREQFLAVKERMLAFDPMGRQFQLYQRLAESELSKFIRHDIKNAANATFGYSQHFREALTDSEDVHELWPVVQGFMSGWSRYFVSMEHLVQRELLDTGEPIDSAMPFDAHILLDAVVGWRQYGKTKRDGKEVRLRDQVTIDDSFRDILDRVDPAAYTANVGMIGHAVRSCLHNAAKSKIGGADVVIRAAIDPETEDIIISIADNGDGLVQSQVTPDSPSNMFGTGTRTSQTGSTGLGLSGLDIHLSRFGIDMSVVSQLAIYPVPENILSPEIQRGIESTRHSFPVGNESASTVFQFRIHKKAA